VYFVCEPLQNPAHFGLDAFDEASRHLIKSRSVSAHDLTACEPWLCNPATQQPTTVGPACSISWDKTNDPKVTRDQLTVINQESPAEKTVLIMPAETTKLPCKDAGANHEGLWEVTVQSCYDTFTCSVPTDIVRMRIASK
jgi:hypothetical protein